MSEKRPCLIYKEPTESLIEFESGTHRVKCWACGRYDMDKLEAHFLEVDKEPALPVGKCRRWIFARALHGGAVPFIDAAAIAGIKARPLRPLATKPDDLLLVLCAFPYPPKPRPLMGSLMLAPVEASTDEELLWIAEILQRRSFVKILSPADEPQLFPGWSEDPNPGLPFHTVEVTQEGYIKAEELSSSSVDSAQGFIAMWFAHEMTATWREGMEVGIRRAGWDPDRVDEGHPDEKVDDEIIMQIRRSRCLVTDFTGNRGASTSRPTSPRVWGER